MLEFVHFFLSEQPNILNPSLSLLNSHDFEPRLSEQLKPVLLQPEPYFFSASRARRKHTFDPIISCLVSGGICAEPSAKLGQNKSPYRLLLTSALNVSIVSEVCYSHQHGRIFVFQTCLKLSVKSPGSETPERP